MAKSLSTVDGTLVIPGAYAKYTVQSNPSGLATTGVLMLVGEANGGPDFTQEEDLEQNAFGPDQLAEVQAKYQGGPLVDSFRAAIAAANDPDITGSLSRCILVKTNIGTKASGALPKIGGGTYATLFDRSYGKAGNGIAYRTTQAQAEVLPTTDVFTYIPPVGAVDYRIRVSGGAAVGSTVSAAMLPPAFQGLIEALPGVTCSGGATRNLLLAPIGARTVAITVTPALSNTIVATIAGGAWDNTPAVGDTLVLPFGAMNPLKGAADENVGAYVVTAASSVSITATKLSDATKPAGVPGTITGPANVLAVSPSAVTDLQAFAPVSISLESGAVIDGVGKSLELAELTTGADLLSRTAFVLGTTTAVSWVSKASSAKLLVSSAEYKVTLSTNQSSTAISESSTVGGEIVLKIGYQGTTATMTLTDDLLTTAVTGGSGGNLSVNLNDFSNIQAVADFIASQTGYSCSVGTAALGNLPAYALDDVTTKDICGQFGTQPGRLKVDAYRFYNEVSGSSSLVQVNDPTVAAQSGLPDVMAAQVFLAGGTWGGTSDATIQAAYAALEQVRGNFLVPLFSRDASEDILDGLTEGGVPTAVPPVPASSYTISAIHAGAKSHVLSMSTLKRRRNRQAFLSIASDFDTSKNVSANIASFRSAVAFQDFKQIGSDGSIQQFLPWMGASLAAGIQAAGFYRNIEHKGINTSGVLSRAGDFNPKNDSQVESALQAGLLVAGIPMDGGGYIFLSDQTSYGTDSNFVFNSIQAVYAADTVSLTMAQRMERACVGQSVADISAAVARSFAESVLADMLRLKLIAPSDDGAPKGYKNLVIKINGNAMLVSCEIKLATAIEFVLINFLVSAVQQSA
jgi:hypothetical protein